MGRRGLFHRARAKRGRLKANRRGVGWGGGGHLKTLTMLLESQKLSRYELETQVSHGKLQTRWFPVACTLYVLITGQFSGQLRTLLVCQSAEPGLPGGAQRLDVTFQASQWL